MNKIKLKKKKGEKLQASFMGWECPRCHKVNSPFVLTCDCPPFTFTFTETGSTTITVKNGKE